MIREGGPEGVPVIVIARQQQDRLANGPQSGARLLIFGSGAAVDDIAGDDHEVGCRIERVQVTNGGVEHRVGVDQSLVQLAPRADVGIGQMGDQQGGGPRSWFRSDKL